MTDPSFELNGYWRQFIADKIASGRFSSPADAIGAALRLLEFEERKYEQLARCIEEGDASGPAIPWDYEAFLAEIGLLDAKREAA